MVRPVVGRIGEDVIPDGCQSKLDRASFYAGGQKVTETKAEVLETAKREKSKVNLYSLTQYERNSEVFVALNLICPSPSWSRSVKMMSASPESMSKLKHKSLKKQLQFSYLFYKLFPHLTL